MSILTNLVAHWRLDEASGTRYDAHKCHHLDEISGTVQRKSGKLSGSLRSVGPDVNEIHGCVHTLDAADFAVGDADFTITLWCTIDSDIQDISVFSPAGWGFNLQNVCSFGYQNDKFYFLCVDNATTPITGVSDTAITPANFDQWYFVRCWRVGTEVGIQVNNGTKYTQAWPYTIVNNNDFLSVGHSDPNLNFFISAWPGRIDSVSWFSAAITDAEAAALYNGGAGIDYPFGEAWTGRAPDMPVLTSEFQPFLFDSLGARKLLPSSAVLSCSWTDDRYGGYKDFTVEVAHSAPGATAITHNDILEFWYRGERYYRGRVFGIEEVEGEPPTLRITGYSLGLRAFKAVVPRAFPYPSPVDISRIFSDMAHESVRNVVPQLLIDAQSVNATAQNAESTYQNFGEAVNALVKTYGENRALWGVDVDDDGYDRLFIKPFNDVADLDNANAVNHALHVPGIGIEAAASNEEGADVVNRLVIRGGTPAYPNLVYNASFERLRFGGSGVGNLLENGGFEAATNWSGSGSYKTSGGGTGEGNAHSGNRMYEIDNNGENLTQTQDPPATAIVEDHDYNISWWAKAETAASSVVGRATFDWEGAAGSVTLDMPAPNTSGPDRLTAYWRQYSLTARAPAGATGFTITFEVVSGGGIPTGILIDDVEVYDASALYQDMWELVANGTAEAGRVNWQFRDGYDGTFSVHIDADTAADADANDLVLRTVAAQRFEVQGGASYRWGAYFKSPLGVTANPKIIIELVEYTAQGRKNRTNKITVASGSGWTDWTVQTSSIALLQTTTHCTFNVRIRGAGEFLVDACFVRDSASTGFIRDGQFVSTISTDDVWDDINEEAQSSVGIFGVMEEIAEIEALTTQEDAQAYAIAYFNARAGVYATPTVTVNNPVGKFRPGEQVRLVGEDGATLMGGLDYLPIVSVKWSWRDMLKASLQIKREQPDLADLFLRKLKKLLGTSSRSYTSTTAGNPPVIGRGPSLTVEEEDGAPSVADVGVMVFPSGSVTDDGDGQVTIEFGQPLTVEDEDANPQVADVVTIVFPEGSVSTPGAGIAEITFPQLTVEELDGTPTETPTTTLIFPNGSLTEPAPGEVQVTFPALTVEEEDGTPTDAAVTTLVFPNDSLTVPTAGEVHVDFASLTVTELDASPSEPRVSEMRFPTTTVTVVSPGVVSIDVLPGSYSGVLTATTIGSHLVSLDGATYTEVLPVATQDDGWIVGDDAHPLVVPVA